MWVVVHSSGDDQDELIRTEELDYVLESYEQREPQKCKGLLVMVLEKFIEGITNQDLAFLESLLHEDMLFVQETTLETKEEWIKDTKEQFKNGMLDATKMEVTKKFETKDMGALEVTMKKDGHLIRFSNVFLYKDNKIYRHLINVVTDHFTE